MKNTSSGPRLLLWDRGVKSIKVNQGPHLRPIGLKIRLSLPADKPETVPGHLGLAQQRVDSLSRIHNLVPVVSCSMFIQVSIPNEFGCAPLDWTRNIPI